MQEKGFMQINFNEERKLIRVILKYSSKQKTTCQWFEDEISKPVFDDISAIKKSLKFSVGWALLFYLPIKGFLKGKQPASKSSAEKYCVIFGEVIALCRVTEKRPSNSLKGSRVKELETQVQC